MAYTDPGDQRAVQSKKRYYLAHKAEYLSRNALKRQRMREWLISEKDNQPCVDCGVRFPHFVLDYDHKDPSRKTGIVSQIIGDLSWKKLFAEVAKCELVCSNCHRIRTQAQGFFGRNPQRPRAAGAKSVQNGAAALG